MFVNYEFTFFRDVEEYRQLQMTTAIQNTLRTGRDMKKMIHNTVRTNF